MKKSEKIEIRISFEEKEALTSLAEKEGRTISQLIRDVVNSYVSLNIGRSVKNRRKPHVKIKTLALLGSGAILGLCTSMLPHILPSKDIYYVHGMINGDAFSFNISTNHQKTQKVIVGGPKPGGYYEGTQPDSYQMNIQVKKGESGQKVLHAKICRNQDTLCPHIAWAVFELLHQGSSTWQSNGHDGSNIYLVTQRQAL